MRWNLRLTAANAGICVAGAMQRLVAERGLVISGWCAPERLTSQ
ncbi:hypothetical protein ACQRWP_16855 [Micromonospora trifolii]